MRIWSKNINYPKPLEKKSKLEICSEIHSTRLEMRSIYANLYRYNAEIKATNSASEKTLIFNKIDNNIKEFAVLKNREKLLKERLKILFSSKEEVLKSNIKKIFNQHFCECKHLEDTFKNEILENLKYYLSDSIADYESLIQDWVKLFQKQNKQQYSQCTLETVFCKRILVKLLPKEPKLLRIFVMQEDTDVAPVEKEVDEVFTSEGGGNF